LQIQDSLKKVLANQLFKDSNEKFNQIKINGESYAEKTTSIRKPLKKPSKNMQIEELKSLND